MFAFLKGSCQSEVPVIRTEPFGDSMRHWYGIHDDENIINPEATHARYTEAYILKTVQHIHTHRINLK